LISWASKDQDGDEDGIFARQLRLLVDGGLTAAPALSLIGLTALGIALVGFGARTVRKRSRR
jgi:hypothetical protein